MLSGRTEKLPYSLSRWTDLPAAKWAWFEEQLNQGWMIGIDPRTALPGKWALTPADVFGLIFWTRNPRNLLRSADRLADYPLVVHFTLTGWHEVERGAPGIEDGLALLRDTVAAFGVERVTWRFSPVPMVTDVLDRFDHLASEAAKLGLPEVFVAFLQENDLLPEGRGPRIRLELLKQFAVRSHGLQVKLCNEDRSLNLQSANGLGPRKRTQPANLGWGICESGERFAKTEYRIDAPATEGCGCALAVDPFTINESCTMGCAYCYAHDRSLAPKKRNTTKGLPVIP